MSCAFITHPDCLLHDMGDIHPESPQRIGAIEDQLIASGLHGLLVHYEAPEVSREQLLRVHTSGYLAMLEAQAPRSGMVQIDQDTTLTPTTLRAARRAAGAVVLATDLVLGGAVRAAFCNVRPPGHHAEPSRAMGFCFFNNVAVGARHALAEHGIERIAIADFDVHHGNGTEAIFEGDPRVMLCSSFQHPLFPFTGHAPRGQQIISVPLDPGANGANFRAAVMDHWFPALERFQPQMLFISAGFDAHIEDDMADLRFTEADYAWVTRELMAIAERHADGRIVSTLEGGYALHALGRSATAHIRILGKL
jgi:acetoin utilization deacetylase AcuC-like enzyme